MLLFYIVFAHFSIFLLFREMFYIFMCLKLVTLTYGLPLRLYVVGNYFAYGIAPAILNDVALTA